MRPTYDEAALLKATSREQVEAQIGHAKMQIALADGGIEATYRTSRMSRNEKANLISGHTEEDGLSLGLAELFHPAFIGEDETAIFTVDYSPQGVPRKIQRRCEARSSTHFSPELGSGMACQNGFIPL